MTSQHAPEPSGVPYHPWTTYIAAREEARARGDRRVGTEHLLVALLLEPGLPEVVGADDRAARAGLAELDREALAAAGIDTDVEAPAPPPRSELPRRPTFRMVLRGRLPMTPVAKKALETSSKGMRRGHRHPGAKHVLASLLELERPDPAAELLAHLGIDAAGVRERLGHV